MSTRSLVGLKYKDGSVTSIYVHSDGYPSYMEPILHQSFNDEKSITELLSHGAARYLEYSIDEISFFEENGSIDLPHFHKDVQSFLNGDTFGACFRYLFIDGKWYYDVPYRATPLTLLPYGQPEELTEDVFKDETLMPWW